MDADPPAIVVQRVTGTVWRREPRVEGPHGMTTRLPNSQALLLRLL